MNQLSIDMTPRAAPYQRHSPTSKAAAEDVEPRTGTQRALVLSFLRGRGVTGATDEEMQNCIPMSANAQRPRRGELKSLIRDSGRTRPTASGNQAVVWVAAEFWSAEA